jgi:copper chaperone CopZ
MTETRTYAVDGMTCGHCVLSVRAAVAEAGYEVAA